MPSRSLWLRFSSAGGAVDLFLARFGRSGPWVGLIIPFTGGVWRERDEVGSRNLCQDVEFPLEGSVG